MNSLEGNEVGSIGAARLFDELRQRKLRLIRVRLNDNQIGDKCMKALGEYIKYNDLLKDVYVGDNGVTDKGIKDLAPYLIGNRTLKYIYFDKNKGITDESFPLLKEILTSSSLNAFDVRNTSISLPKEYEVSCLVRTPVHSRARDNIESSSTSVDSDDANDGELDNFVDTSEKLPGWVKRGIKIGKQKGFGEMGWLDLSKE